MVNKLTGEVIALDIGRARTGVARINTIARIAEALEPIYESETELTLKLGDILLLRQPSAVVLGLPRGLDGQETEQTAYVRGVLAELRAFYPSTTFYTVDEAGTTKEAENRAKHNESVDSVAAGILAEDFLTEVSRGNVDGLTL